MCEGGERRTLLPRRASSKSMKTRIEERRAASEGRASDGLKLESGTEVSGKEKKLRTESTG